MVPQARGRRALLDAGFYMTQRIPTEIACVKTVFPMPDGNATVVLRPINEGRSVSA